MVLFQMQSTEGVKIIAGNGATVRHFVANDNDGRPLGANYTLCYSPQLLTVHSNTASFFTALRNCLKSLNVLAMYSPL